MKITKIFDFVVCGVATRGGTMEPLDLEGCLAP